MALTQYKQQNLFIDQGLQATYWYSYQTLIAICQNNQLFLTNAKYSRTTTNHCKTVKQESKYLGLHIVSPEELSEMELTRVDQ